MSGPTEPTYNRNVKIIQEPMDTGASSLFSTNLALQQQSKPVTSYKQNFTTVSQSDDEEDPFANLPKPVPVPVRTGVSENGGTGNQFNRQPPPPPSSGTSYRNFGGVSNQPENFRRTFSLRTPSSRNRSFYGQANTGVQAEFGSNCSAGQPNNLGRNGQTFEYNRYSPSQFNLGGSNQYSGGYTSQSTNTSQRQPSLGFSVENIKDLSKLGRFDCLPHASQKFQTVSKYVENSSGLNDQNGQVTVHDVFEINKNDWLSYLKSLYSFGEPGTEQHLLWFKTSPKGVQRLAQQNDGCVAFYDRLCRALPENPSNMQKPLRQLMLLCSVSLGRVYESPHGFQHWSAKGGVPHGFSTIKGMGKFVPYWGENFGDDSVIVPCGKTIQNQKFQTYNLDFNEYIVFEGKRIKIKYAVDVEIKPASSRHQDVSETYL